MPARWIRVLAALGLLVSAVAFPGSPVLAQTVTDNLTVALNEQIAANQLLTNPALGAGNVAAIRAAVTQATPHVQSVQSRLQAAQGQASGQTLTFIQLALTEVNAELAIGQLILTGPDNLVVVRLGELVVRGGVALGNINLALLTLGTGPSAPQGGRILQATDLQVPTGYRVEVIANTLNFATAVAVGQDGAVYVAESGYSYGNVQTTPRVLRFRPPDQTPQVVATGVFTGPVAGLAISGTNTLFVSHRNTISRVDVTSGATTPIITGLPSLGDHFNENIAIGPDGKLYITQGTATNSGVVGPDNYFFGWLQQYPTFHDFPCRNLTLNGTNFVSGNPLTPDPADTATTGAVLPFGTPSTSGQTLTGQVKCNGAVLRANPDGSGLEVFADGFRNNYGLAFDP